MKMRNLKTYSLAIFTNFAAFSLGACGNHPSGDTSTTSEIPTLAAASNDFCGDNFTQYAVKTNDASSAGIRCVKMEGNITWYGEGHWGDKTYRHIGWANRTSGTPAIAQASAYDLSGNGETVAGGFSGNLRLQPSTGGTAPDTITVSGAWNEVWQRSGQSGYRSRLGRVVACGPNFQTFTVQKTGMAGSGVRCVPINGEKIWLGAGDWNGYTYSHLGRLYDSTWTQPEFSVGATDICGLGRACAAFGFGQIKFRRTEQGYDLSGAWNESWLRRD